MQELKSVVEALEADKESLNAQIEQLKAAEALLKQQMQQHKVLVLN